MWPLLSRPHPAPIPPTPYIFSSAAGFVVLVSATVFCAHTCLATCRALLRSFSCVGISRQCWRADQLQLVLAGPSAHTSAQANAHHPCHHHAIGAQACAHGELSTSCETRSCAGAAVPTRASLSQGKKRAPQQPYQQPYQRRSGGLSGGLPSRLVPPSAPHIPHEHRQPPAVLDAANARHPPPIHPPYRQDHLAQQELSPILSVNDRHGPRLTGLHEGLSGIGRGPRRDWSRAVPSFATSRNSHATLRESRGYMSVQNADDTDVDVIQYV